MYEPALAELQNWRELRDPPPPPGMYEVNLAGIEAAAGNRDKGRKILAENWAHIAKSSSQFGALAATMAKFGFSFHVDSV